MCAGLRTERREKALRQRAEVGVDEVIADKRAQTWIVDWRRGRRCRLRGGRQLRLAPLALGPPASRLLLLEGTGKAQVQAKKSESTSSRKPRGERAHAHERWGWEEVGWLRTRRDSSRAPPSVCLRLFLPCPLRTSSLACSATQSEPAPGG